MGFVAVIPTVVISITGPIIWDAAAAVALELSAGAGVAAARFVAVVAAVVIWKTNTFVPSRSARAEQRFTFIYRRKWFLINFPISSLSVKTNETQNDR